MPASKHVRFICQSVVLLLGLLLMPVVTVLSTDVTPAHAEGSANAGTSEVSLQLQPTTTTLNASFTIIPEVGGPYPYPPGLYLGMTARVWPYYASGPVIFSDLTSNRYLGTSNLMRGRADLFLAFPVDPSVRSYTFMATYTGDTNYAGSRATYVLAFPPPPIVIDPVANVLSPYQASLSGKIIPFYSETLYAFLVAPVSAPEVPACPDRIENPDGQLPAVGTYQQVSKVLKDLQPNTSYNYRLAASNEVGLVCSDIRSFRTGADPLNYSLLTLGDTSLTNGGSEITGKVGIGGNFTAQNFNLATGQSGWQNNVLVNGNVSLTYGQVKGNLVYGGTLTATGASFIQGTAIQQGNALETTNTGNYLRSVGEAWRMKGGTPIAPRYGGYNLTVGSGTTYFLLQGSELANANNLTINAPAGATVILNINGITGDRMQYMGISLAGGIDRQHVVYNFYEAQDLTINGVGVEGTVWAPQAAVIFPNGQLRGALVAKSLVGYSARFEYYPLQAGVLPS